MSQTISCRKCGRRWQLSVCYGYLPDVIEGGLCYDCKRRVIVRKPLKQKTTFVLNDHTVGTV
jgi:hypothetical protein